MKLIITVFMITSLLSGCKHKEREVEQQNMDLTRSLFDAFNGHNWKTMADYYADTASFLDPSLGTVYVKQSHAEMIKKYSEMQAMFPDIHDEVSGIYPHGDKVSVEFVSTGKSADGIAFQLPICTIFTFNNGKIVKDATYYDNE